jgi:hypothetical protein
MSTFRHIDDLLDRKTSEDLARDVAARRERADQDQSRAGRIADALGGGESRSELAEDPTSTSNSARRSASEATPPQVTLGR